MKIDSEIYNITASSFDKYLVLHGWKKDYNFPNKKLSVYKRKYNTIVVPSSEKYADFYNRVYEAIDVLSKIENESFEKVFNEILIVDIDRIEFRIVSNETSNGKLPLQYASKCIDGLKELILYSAYAEKKKQPLCVQLPKTYKNYLDNFQLAQTDVGSFILKIDAKVIDNIDEKCIDGLYPKTFEHKVYERIDTALSQLEKVTNGKCNFTDLTENCFEDGITANMCDALLKLKSNDSDAMVYTTIKYAPDLSKNKSKKIFNLDNNYFASMREISRIFKDKKIYDNVGLRGFVTALKKSESGPNKFRIINLYTNYEGKNRIVSLQLDKEYYKLACDAHRDNLEIYVEGILDMSELRYWSMVEIKNFKVIKDESN